LESNYFKICQTDLTKFSGITTNEPSYLSNCLADFDDARNLQLYRLKTIHHAKSLFYPTMLMVWANTQFSTVRFLSFLVTSSRAQVAPVDRTSNDVFTHKVKSVCSAFTVGDIPY